MAANPKHGEIWLADLGIAGKTRPVVVLLADDVPVERTLIIYVPLTTQNRGSVLEVSLGHLRFLDKASVANVQGVGALPLRDSNADSAPCRWLIWIESSKPCASPAACEPAEPRRNSAASA